MPDGRVIAAYQPKSNGTSAVVVVAGAAMGTISTRKESGKHPSLY